MRSVEVPLVANRELLQEVIPGSRSTRFVAFDSNTELHYETGDHVAIYPCNPPELVKSPFARLSVTPNTFFTAVYVTPDGTEVEEPPVAVPTTVEQVLFEELDLSLREPFNDLLTYLHSAAQNPQDKHRLP